MLLDYIEECVAEVSLDFPLADIVLAGDVNQLSEQDIIERTGLTQIVHQPTRGGNILDRVFVSDPDIFKVVRVVASVVKSDHKAVVCLTDRQSSTAPKTRERRSFWRHTPSQHAKFLEIAASIDFTNPLPTASSDLAINTQAEFDNFYRVALSILDEMFPTQTVTSRDHAPITPEIKAMLRRKNRLMRDGRAEKAGVIAARIGKKITAQSRLQLRGINARTDAKALWAAVQKLTNAGKSEIVVDGITAQSLNDYYAATSTDSDYVEPKRRRQTGRDGRGAQQVARYVSEWQVFQLLDKLRPTAAGTDGLPAWYLKLGVPVFCGPLQNLFNQSIATSTVPTQWRQAAIRPAYTDIY